MNRNNESIGQNRNGEDALASVTSPVRLRSPSRARKSRLATRRAIVTYLPIGSIVPDPSNPRKHSPEQIRAIANSIEAFGFNAPILGRQREPDRSGARPIWRRRSCFGLAEAPVIRLEHLSEQQAKAYMLADNKLTDRSSWDDRKVAIVLKELSDIALDFEIEATGFEAPEIDLRIQSLEPPDESTDSADEFEAPMVRRYPASTTCGPLATTASSAGTHWIRRPMTRSSLERKPPPFSRIPPTMSG